jgi:glycosyltransferase involved in cell wall biosynthesis
MNAAPILVYLVTEDWYFLSHRLPMASAARRAGYEVHVLTNVRDHGAAIEAHGFHLHPLSWRRGSLNPPDVLAIIREVRGLYRVLAPDLVHHVALQPAIIGSLAALGLPVRRLNAVAGLGFAFTSNTPKARLVRMVLSGLLRTLLNSPRASVLVQNPDDHAAVGTLGVSAERIFLVPGSGVDVDVLTPLPEPDGPTTAAFVGRLLEDKGVRTLLAAHELLARRRRPVRLLIAGEPDPANPASIPVEEIERWKRQPGVVMLGHVANIRDVWSAAHIAVLPSRREGLPKSLLEAAAFGRPIVATDVPGCREIARANVNALLVPPDDPAALAEAIDRLAADPDLRQRFGLAARHIVEDEFSSDRIGREIVALYDRLLGRNVLPAAAAGG